MATADPIFVGGCTAASNTFAISDVAIDLSEPVVSGDRILAGDFLLLIVETANQSITTPSGWTALANQGVNAAGGTTATALYTYYRFADATIAVGNTTFSVSDSGDHQLAKVLIWRGVDSATPMDATATGDTLGAASTSVTMPGITTATDKAFVVQIVSTAVDSAAQPASTATNAGLASCTLLGWAATTSGNGGGFAAFGGIRTTAGATGTGSTTLAASGEQARVTAALRAGTLGNVRGGQLPVEVLRTNTNTALRVGHLAVEVLRPNAALATNAARPFVFCST